MEIPHLKGEFPCIGYYLKKSSSQRVRLHGGKHIALLVHYKTFSFIRMPVVIHCQHRHMTSFACNQITSFGIELHTDGLGEITRVDAFTNSLNIQCIHRFPMVGKPMVVRDGSDGQVGIVPLCLRLLENGNDTGEHGVRAPVGHVACIGTYLIQPCPQNRV